ncbi:uncharacterized protein LOC143891921 [Tasmannia lanceolata]|uniref:uncharacterized protein LOC143891921 n=1 Tax=Tasmannia lanceolata TaxID=3420 RepID=UPI004063265C
MGDYVKQIRDYWAHFGNYARVIKGRIWLLRDPIRVNMQIINDSSQFVHAKAQLIHTNQSLYLTAVYGRNYGGDRKILWQDLEAIEPSIDSIGTIGHPLSWNNRASYSELKYARLDRALVNDFWIQDHPLSFAEYKPPGVSDHSPIIVSLKEYTSLGPKPFRFLDMWLDDPSLYAVVERAWSTKIKGNPMYRSKLEDAQNRLAQNPADRNLRDKEKEARDEFFSIARSEESMMRQKSRISWLCEGDTNSKFFHAAVKSRYHRNHIVVMEREDSTISYDPSEISNILVKFYWDLLNKYQNLAYNVPSPDKKLTDSEASHISRDDSEEEIREAVFSGEGSKVPGPDSFNGNFFKILNWARSHFSSSELLPQGQTAERGE